MRAEINKHSSAHVFQNVSFLYIIVLCQLQLIELSRFQYYLDCNHIFNLFYNIEIYIYKISLFLLQHIKIYSSKTLLFNALFNELLKTLFMICIIIFIML